MQRLKWRSFLLLIPLVAIIVVVLYLEGRHRLAYGDFVFYGVHAHVMKRSADIGIRGVESMYAVDGFNYTIFPITIKGCKEPSDVSPYYQVKYRYQVEKWDSNAGAWNKVVSLKPGDCPQDQIVSSTLRPSESLRIVDWEATAAREGFQIGDFARFVAYAQFDSPDGAPGQKAFISRPVRIEEQPRDHSSDYRIGH